MVGHSQMLGGCGFVKLFLLAVFERVVACVVHFAHRDVVRGLDLMIFFLHLDSFLQLDLLRPGSLGECPPEVIRKNAQVEHSVCLAQELAIFFGEFGACAFDKWSELLVQSFLVVRFVERTKDGVGFLEVGRFVQRGTRLCDFVSFAHSLPRPHREMELFEVDAILLFEDGPKFRRQLPWRDWSRRDAHSFGEILHSKNRTKLELVSLRI
jgi:hypothetical protein